jgi:hypothetical protein
MIVAGETPADVGVATEVGGAVVGGAVVEGEVVSVVVHMSGRPTVAVTVLVNSSGHVATTVIVTAPVTAPGTTVVAFVVSPPGTGFVTTETSYATPAAFAVALTFIALRARPFVMVHVTTCEPSEHDATPVTAALCAPAGSANARDAAMIARQVKDFVALIASVAPIGR